MMALSAQEKAQTYARELFIVPTLDRFNVKNGYKVAVSGRLDGLPWGLAFRYCADLDEAARVAHQYGEQWGIEAWKIENQIATFKSARA